MPPNDPETERRFLACLLMSLKNVSMAESRIEPADFYSTQNQHLFQVIIKLSKKIKEISHSSLCVNLSKNEKLLGYLLSLSLDDCLPHDLDFQYYLSQLKNLSVRRKQIELAVKIFNESHNENISAEASIEELKACLEKSKTSDETGIVEISEIYDKIDELYEKGLQRGLSTGWMNLDDYYTVRPAEITVITGVPSHGKALDIKTIIPTLHGFKTMEEIKIGDILFDENGNRCNVINCTKPMYNRPCYKLEFSDGTKIICDEEHLWFTRTDKARRSQYVAKTNNRLVLRQLKPRGTNQTFKRTFPKAVTTKEIFNTLCVENGKRFNHCIASIVGIKTYETWLPLNPYVFGAWLGDGNSSSPAITCAYKDKQIIDEIEKEGVPIHENKSSNINTGLFYLGNKGRHSKEKSLTVLLRKMGVLSNKHIPENYLFASAKQRLALLQGLMDTDGHITDYGRCEFTNVNKLLADGVFNLITSLGMIPKLIIGKATIYGKDCGIKYRITFTPHLPVFRLKRKLQFVRLHKRERLKHRRIVSCEKTESVPVKCIEVDSPSKLFAVSNAFILTHNSTWNTNLIFNIAKRHSWKFAVFTPENNPIQRYVAHLMQLDVQKPFSIGKQERIKEEEKNYSREWLNEHFVFIMPKSDEMRIDNLIGKATICVLKHGVKGIVLDPWNEIDHTRPLNLSETEYISKCLSKLRYFARAYQVHIWLIAHPTKMLKRQDGSYPVPTPYDISGSAHFRNKADCCLTVWRDLEPDTTRQLETDIYIQKVRFHEVGRIGKVTLKYNPMLQSYENFV